MNAAYLAIFVGLIMLTYGCTAAQQPTNGTESPPIITNSTPLPNATYPPEPTTPQGMTEAVCVAGHGHWNDCGSACRGSPPGTICEAVCVAYCECGGVAGFGCPQGYQCSDYLPLNKDGLPAPDSMGICKK